MLVAHKIRLYPTKGQSIYLSRCCGHARFAYNYGLGLISECYEKEKVSISCNEVSKLLTQMNKTQEYGWLKQASSVSITGSVRDLDTAFKNFYASVKQGRKPAYPRFKKKGIKDSFHVGQTFEVEGKVFIMPAPRYADKEYKKRIKRIKMAEKLRFVGSVNKYNTVISRTADKWFVSILVDVPEATYQANNILLK